MYGKKVMAGRLLSVAVAAVLVHGCLLPQEDQVFADLPPKKNSYPRIVEGLQKPTDQAVSLELGANCKRTVFSVVVEDPDVADRIRNKWFVDPDIGFTTVSFSTQSLGESKLAIRNTPFSAPTQLFSPGSQLYEPGMHRLVVVIADGEFEASSIATTPRSILVNIDGGSELFSDPSYTDTYTWNVTTSLAPCGP